MSFRLYLKCNNMEIQETIQESIHPLFDKFEDYTKTSVELAKLKTISKTGDIVSIMAFQLLAFIFLTLFVLAIVAEKFIE